MVKNIFDFQDYKAYLGAYLRGQPGAGRGLRAKMAKVISCQRSFVTKVLDVHSVADLSLEQAEQLNSFLNHSEEESRYFLLLAQYARAGTPNLREYFRDQMKEVLNRRLEAKKELQSRSVLSPEDHMHYYSSWFYAAIRIAVSLPNLQTKEALSRKFNLPLPFLVSVLEFLSSRGLIEQKGDRFFHSSQQQVLMTPDHPLISKHHTNWRVQAIKSLELQSPRDLHYSYLVSLSENDALQIRSLLVESIQEVLRRAAPSKEEAIYSFCLDYFEI
jgi:uncharacterized protein (TIGR02147 family)